MQPTEIMVRYGELSTKGKNKKQFINQLKRNVKQSLSDFPTLKVTANHDRMHINLNEEKGDQVITRVKDVFGIQNMSPVIRIEKDIEIAKKSIADLVEQKMFDGASFKINTRRSDHAFEYDTFEMNRILGDAVVQRIPEINVQMKNPDITVRTEVRLDGIYLSIDTIDGAGGMPVGSAGKGMLMMSGGIDSPVAGYLSMKRGVDVEAVHFYSPPYTSPQALQKAKDLTAKIARYSGSVNFIQVPFTEIQEEIKDKIPEGYIMTITRRMMLRLTDLIREQRGGLAIMNGESLGQVASQTLESMMAINDVTTTPIIRPLVSMDKNEIVDIAEDIDTFELSILPYEDCCTIFTPPRPKTKPSVEKSRQYEENIDVDGLIQRALEGIEIENIGVKDNQEAQLEEEFEGLL